MTDILTAVAVAPAGHWLNFPNLDSTTALELQAQLRISGYPATAQLIFLQGPPLSTTWTLSVFTTKICGNNANCVYLGCS